MEYVILGAIIVAFSSISSKLSSIKNKMDNQTKSKINLLNLISFLVLERRDTNGYNYNHFFIYACIFIFLFKSIK